MALWMVRAGRFGEFEQRFLDTGRIYVTWSGLKYDLSKVNSKAELRELLQRVYPGNGLKKVINNTGQIWPFVNEMQPGDWVVVPSKLKSAIHIAEIKSPYVFDSSAENPYYHHRDVNWVARDVPRSNFKQDLLYSFGAFMTICRIERNEAEKRVRLMAASGWKSETLTSTVVASGGEGDEEESQLPVDLERLARDQIARAIIRKYKGHGLARLVDAVLRAQGYVTYVSPEGPDKGIDILAAPGPLGFGKPRLCVQVKSGDSPVDSPTLNQLIGSMQNVQADQGLLASWGGFKSSVDREAPVQFFRVRLWDQDALIDELMAHYIELDEDFKADLPLKRIWTIADQDRSPDEEDSD
jgi:restriction system protein